MNTKIAIITIVSILSAQASYAGDRGKVRRNSDPCITLPYPLEETGKKAHKSSPQTAKKLPKMFLSSTHENSQSQSPKKSTAPGLLPTEDESRLILAAFNAAYKRAQQQRGDGDHMQDDVPNDVVKHISKEPDCIPMVDE